ncbi:hypothetical protein EC968_003698 [Mortierella alpina]|nr:hypothetical protein EC968_003698 [Mortierella alpina]
MARKSAYVYYDNEVYDSVLTEKSTGITHVIQLIFDSKTKVYYVYYRWGEADYRMDGPHETIESAKEAFQVTYKEKFDVPWEERETTSSERWICEVKTYETLEECEEVEEAIEGTEAEMLVDENKIAAEITTTVAEGIVTEDHETEKEAFVVEDDKEKINEAVITKEAGKLTKPAVSGVPSWFHRVVSAASAVVQEAEEEETEEDFKLEKGRPLAEGTKSGSAGLSADALASVRAASLM